MKFRIAPEKKKPFFHITLTVAVTVQNSDIAQKVSYCI